MHSPIFKQLKFSFESALTIRLLIILMIYKESRIFNKSSITAAYKMKY